MTAATDPTGRRDALKRSGAVAACAIAGWLPAGRAAASAHDPAFEATTLDEAFLALGGVPTAAPGIVLVLADVVENGAVVPVSVTSLIPGTQEIALVVELNPYPLIARFTIPPGTEPYIATRVKLAQSGSVCAVVKAEGRLYSVTRETKVLAGGCGG